MAVISAGVLAGLLSLSGPAWPCAALMVEDGGSASTSAQEFILEAGVDFVDVTYRVQVDNDVNDLGWVIPIYGDFVSLEDADPTRFDDLRELTAPTVWIESPEDSSDSAATGCGRSKGAVDGGRNAAADTAGSQDGDLGIDVVAHGFSGTYAFTMLEASSDTALMAWLDDNAFGMGPTGPAVSAYVAEGGVRFVVLRVAMGTQDGATHELPAVKIRYSGDRLRFPALMAQYGMPPQVSTRAFVIGDQRATVVGPLWSSEKFGSRAGGNTGDSSADDAYRAALVDIGGGSPVYAEIWSGAQAGAWLTRFDLIADKDVHQADLEFHLDGGQVDVSSELWRWDTGDVAWLLGPVGLLGLAGLRRRQLDPPTGC